MKLKKELNAIEQKLANMCAEENRKIIMDELSGLDCEDGSNNGVKLW